MAKKKRVYVPVTDYVKNTIAQMAITSDRSEAYVSEKLIEDGIRYNQLEQYTINPSIDPVIQFKLKH